MPFVVDATIRDELRTAGLSAQGHLPRLLTLLRQSQETHLSAGDVTDLAARAGLAITRAEVGHQLDILAEHGLLSRLPTAGAEPVFDTIPEPHAHFMYGEEEIIDLHVSGETLIAMVRDALERRPGEVEVLIRFRSRP